VQRRAKERHDQLNQLARQQQLTSKTRTAPYLSQAIGQQSGISCVITD